MSDVLSRTQLLNGPLAWKQVLAPFSELAGKDSPDSAWNIHSLAVLSSSQRPQKSPQVRVDGLVFKNNKASTKGSYQNVTPMSQRVHV